MCWRPPRRAGSSSLSAGCAACRRYGTREATYIQLLAIQAICDTGAARCRCQMIRTQACAPRSSVATRLLRDRRRQITSPRRRRANATGSTASGFGSAAPNLKPAADGIRVQIQPPVPGELPATSGMRGCIAATGGTEALEPATDGIHCYSASCRHGCHWQPGCDMSSEVWAAGPQAPTPAESVQPASERS